MSRKALIRTVILLLSLCVTMWTIPTAIEALDAAPSRVGGSGLPGPHDLRSLDPDAPLPPTRDQWLEQHAGEPDDLRLIATPDPDLTPEQRAALLEEAKANAPRSAETQDAPD